MQLSSAGARVPSAGMTPHGRDGANVQTRGKYSKVYKARYVMSSRPPSPFEGRAEFQNGHRKIYQIVMILWLFSAKCTKTLRPRLNSRLFSSNLPLEPESQDSVLRVMTLAAIWADQIRPQVGAFTIIIFGNSKGRATTARDQEHGEMLVLGLFHLRPSERNSAFARSIQSDGLWCWIMSLKSFRSLLI
jgi:hypothetical protein